MRGRWVVLAGVVATVALVAIGIGIFAGPRPVTPGSPAATASSPSVAATSAAPGSPSPAPAGPTGPGPYYEAFRFSATWAELPEGQPIDLAPSAVVDAYGKGGGFFTLLGGTATITKEKYDRYLTSAGIEGDCAILPDPCYRFRVDARFRLHHDHEGGAIVAAPRWCVVQVVRLGGQEAYFNAPRDFPQCVNDSNPSFLRSGGWPWMSWSGGTFSPVVWRADRETYGRPQHQMQATVGFEIRVAAHFPCDGETEWVLAREQPQPVEQIGTRPMTEYDLRAEIERWAEIVAKAEDTTDAIAQETIAGRYPDLVEHLDEVKELVTALRDLVDATSPEATDEKKAELLAKYAWDGARKILGYLKVSTVVLDAIETGYEIGTPIGQRLAEGCATVTMIDLRNRAQLGYNERFGSTVSTDEYEYDGRRFRRLADGTFEVRIAGDPVGFWRHIPGAGFVVDREPVWIPLPH